MGFTTLTFLFVLMPAFLVLYFVFEKVFRRTGVKNVVLILFSVVFYYWLDRGSLAMFAFLILVVYFAGFAIGAARTGKRLAVPVIVMVCLLVFYKSASYLFGYVDRVIGKQWLTAKVLIIPVGISYFVFASISYVVDIYRGDTEPGSLTECLLFLSFFPKLVAGPIVRWKDFQPQVKERHSKGEDMAAGIDRIIVGLAKKVILADTFAVQIAAIDHGIAAGGVDWETMWLKMLLYSLQLYFDFSGYSDIAIGLCRYFGFSVRENFNCPYLSTSISDFWRKWHISLGTWFREYVYIPLGGNRRGNVYIHLMIVFLLTGFWHGNGWTFLIWGCVHGLFAVLERALQGRRWYKAIPAVINWMFTMAIVGFAWILFASPDPASAKEWYVGMFTTSGGAINYTWRYYLSAKIILLLLISIAGIVLGIPWIRDRLTRLRQTLVGTLVYRFALLALLAVVFVSMVSSTYRPFLYAQF
ncbi:MAG: MBOAT family protein [Lachnospiraceae bacterium]|nr:MBOAT family protein [Lachnospiraceae bacterium]